MWFFKKKPPQPPPDPWELSRRLLRLGPNDYWTLADAFCGTFISGETGGGKTSGSGFTLAMAKLKLGFGGLVLCAKSSERKLWERYCKLAGRESDLIIFDASGQHRFSFLDEEVKRKGSGAGLTENVVLLLSTILEIAERNESQGGREDEGYWKRALRQLCRNLVDLLIIATGRVTVPDLYQLVVSAPTSRDLLESESWKERSFFFQCLKGAEKKEKTAREKRTFELIADYFMFEYVNLSDKTRSIIVSTFTSMVDVLNRNLLHDLFSTDTTVRPEETFNGKIIVIDLPIQEFQEIGLFASVLWKFCFQRAVERRDLSINSRPVFLFADEFQHFAVDRDQEFQTTARSSKVATVYLTQNISNLYAKFGGVDAKAVTDSLLGNLATKIFHLNSDPQHNEWCSSVLGRSRQTFMNMNSSFAPAEPLAEFFGQAGQPQISSGLNEHMDFEVQPRRFTKLRSGGPLNHWQVDAVFYQGGRRFSATGKNWMPVTFHQLDGRVIC